MMSKEDPVIFCAYHPDIASIASCTRCGKPICYRCTHSIRERSFCSLRCTLLFYPALLIRGMVSQFQWMIQKMGHGWKWIKKTRWIVPGTIGIGFSILIVEIAFLKHQYSQLATEIRQGLILTPGDTAQSTIVGLYQPPKGGMVTSSTISISGEAEPNRIVALSVNGMPIAVTLPERGHFSFDQVVLPKGTSRIEVRAITPDGHVSILQVLNVSYWTETQEILARDFRRGPLDWRALSLTFDGGSSNNVTDEILDMLKQFQVRATFFLTGEFIRKYPHTVRRIVAEGHEVGNHTWSHPHLTTYAENGLHTTREGITEKVIRDELLKTAALFKAVTGREMAPLWRAPYGEYNPEILKWAASVGFRHVGWTTGTGWRESMDTMDWVTDKNSKAYHTADEIAQKILNFARSSKPGANGAIVLMHLGSERKEDRPHKKLPEIIQGLQKEGYSLVTISELISRKREGFAVSSSGSPQ